MIETIKSLFGRDLRKLVHEIESYPTEEGLWAMEEGIINTGGNLCLHIIGNLNAYIGVGLTGTTYIRKRDLEFSLKNIPKMELIKKIEETILIVEKGLDTLTAEQLNKDFPIIIWDKPSEIGYTLVHLLSHLNYHLGQINYHRRLLAYKDNL